MKFRLQSLALAGLCVVILGIGGNAVWVSQKTNSAAARSKFATQLSDAYEKARFSVAAEESLERKYRLEPSAAVGKIYDAAAEEFVDALEVVRARGSASDIQLVGRLLKTQRRYRQAISAMFTAVDAGQTKRVLAIDSTRVDPRFSVIEQQVQARAATRSLEAAAQLHSLRTS